MTTPLTVLCGQLLVVGLAGTELSAAERQLFETGQRGGIVLFRRNIKAPASVESFARVAALVRSVREASESAGPPALVAIDQEGGRVVRLGAPALTLPPMKRIGELDDLDLARRLAETQARELAALGITMSFGPVADVHTRPENPIIGDRAFARTPERVASFAAAWAEGLTRGGILACAKHFPGHGDTTVDSHLALPRVERERAGLEAIEIMPFRALARSPAVAAMMTAHIVYPALDPARPATLSRAIATDLLRGELGFEGVLFSDDLEMKAIELTTGEAAVLAIAAGCDALLVCSRDDLAEEAEAALVREAETSPAFRARCEEANQRFGALRSRAHVAAADETALAGIFAASDPIASELARRLEELPVSVRGTL